MSNAVVAVRYLLANDAAVLAAVPAIRIKAGALPINTVLPALSIDHISTVERNTVAMNTAEVFATSRVQVTVFSKTYSQCKSILELVRKALPHTRGSTGGVDLDSILPDSANPDIYDAEDGVHMQSRDFIVQFSEAT